MFAVIGDVPAGVGGAEERSRGLGLGEVACCDEAADAVGGGVEGGVALAGGGVGDPGGFAGEGDLAVTEAARCTRSGLEHGLPDLVGCGLFGLPLVFEGSDEHPYAVTFKPEPAERPALVGDARFYVPAYFGPGGWLALDFTAAPVDWDEVTELMATSYRQVALKRMLKTLDAPG